MSRRSDGRTANIVYLDQIKWIDLALAVTAPAKHHDLRAVLEVACDTVASGKLLLPLTASNIIETFKINRRKQRFDLAYTQAVLSGSQVFRGHHRRIEIEISQILSLLYDLKWSDPDPCWFLSNIFLEAFAEVNDPRAGLADFSKAAAAISRNPKEALFRYFMETPEAERIEAVRRFTVGCEELRVRIEGRRVRHKAEHLSVRRRVYSAITAIENQDLIIAIACQLGLPPTCLGDKGGNTLRTVIRDTPAFHVEREIALRLEAQKRSIELADMCDMRTFCTVLPYANIVIAEAQFINLARQAGLHTRYNVHLETDIRALPALLT